MGLFSLIGLNRRIVVFQMIVAMRIDSACQLIRSANINPSSGKYMGMDSYFLTNDTEDWVTWSVGGSEFLQV